MYIKDMEIRNVNLNSRSEMSEVQCQCLENCKTTVGNKPLSFLN